MDNIEQIRIADAEQSLDLSAFAFQYELSEEDKKKKIDDLILEEHWGYYQNDKLAAKLRLIPMHFMLCGQPFKMGGIASVATWPQYRRKGMVGKLLTHSLQVMKQSGHTISVLHPFSFSFYRKYGWEINTQYKHYTIHKNQFPVIKDVEGSIERLSEPKLQWKQIHDVYTQFSLRYNGMLQRDEAWWQQHVVSQTKRLVVIYYDEDSIAQGYLIYHVEKREMIVKELICLNEIGRRGLWQFICQHDSMIDNVSLVAPPDDPLAFLLPEPTIRQEIKPYSMARIVDVKNFMEQFPFAVTAHPKSLIFSIADTQAPWNNGMFKLEINAAGKAMVSEIADASSIGADDVISCDIQSLSAMMTGYQRPLNLYKYGRLTGAEALIRIWDESLPKREVYLIDFF